MYKCMYYLHFNRDTNALNRIRNQKQIPSAYRKKIIEVNLDVTYNSCGRIDQRSKRLVVIKLIEAQIKAPPNAYFKISYRNNAVLDSDTDSDEDFEELLYEPKAKQVFVFKAGEEGSS